MAARENQEKPDWVDLETKDFPQELAATLKAYGQAEVMLKRECKAILTDHPKVANVKDGYGFKFSFKVNEATGSVVIGYAECKLPKGSSGKTFNPFASDEEAEE